MLDRWPDAERDFERALTLNRRLGARTAVARTQRAFAEMLLARAGRGDRARAAALLAAASEAAETCGAHGLAQRARVRLASLGVLRPGGPP